MGGKKKRMGADGRTAHDFFSKLMGGKIKKKQWANNGRLTKNMDYVQKNYTRRQWAYNFTVKGENKKKFIGNLPMLFFFE